MKQLSESDRLKLLGLQVLASQHRRMLESIEKAVAEIIGEHDAEHGWASDFVYGYDITPEELWKRSAGARDGA